MLDRVPGPPRTCPGPTDRQCPGPRPALRQLLRVLVGERRQVLRQVRGADDRAATTKLDHRDARERHGEHPEVREWQVEQGQHHDLEHAVVAHEDRPRLARLRADARVAAHLGTVQGSPREVAAQPLEDRRQGRSDPLLHLAGRLAARSPRLPGPATPAGQDVRPAPADLVVGHALPLALADLQQPGLRPDDDARGRRPVGGRRLRDRVRHGLCRLGSACQRGSGRSPAAGRRARAAPARRAVARAAPRRALPGAVPRRTAASRPGPGTGSRRSIPTRRAATGRASRRGPRG